VPKSHGNNYAALYGSITCIIYLKSRRSHNPLQVDIKAAH